MSAGWDILLIALLLLGVTGFAFILFLSWQAEQFFDRIQAELDREAERVIKLVEYRHGEDR